MLSLKDLVSHQNEEVNEKGEGLNQFDPPPIFDDYGSEEILGYKNYGDEELLDFEGLGEALVPSPFCVE